MKKFALSLVVCTLAFAFGAQGEAGTLDAMIPESLTVVRVSGDNIRDWSLKKAGKFQQCTVELLRPVTGNQHRNRRGTGSVPSA